MLRHIVLIRWRPEATEEQRETARKAIAAFPAHIPEITAMQCGANLGQGANHHDYALVADFADRDAFQRYVQHPAHRDYAEGPGKVAVSSLACLQHEW